MADTGLLDALGYDSLLRRAKGDWIVVEAYYSKVHLMPLKDFMKRYDVVAIGRVDAPLSVRLGAIEFALGQLGKPYSFDYFKIPKVFDSSYYCSELVWASYMYASNGSIDLDVNPGWSWKYGYAVAPQEVYDSPLVSIVYYSADGLTLLPLSNSLSSNVHSINR